MMEHVEEMYSVIGQAIVDSISSDWVTANVEAEFFPHSTLLFGDYELPTGSMVSFDLGNELVVAFEELRKRFKETGQPLWGRATFKLSADGAFRLLWGYDNCDADGNSICSEESYQRRILEQIERCDDM